MSFPWRVQIAGTGLCLPERIVTNDDLAQRLDTSDEWITKRTGIKQRRYASPEQSTLYFARGAAEAALKDAKLAAEDIDLILVATATPEHPLPSTACELQHALGCRTIPAFDIQAACAGYVYGFVNASQQLVTKLARNVLLVGVDTLTRITDHDDRGTAILFGDGAGAVVLRETRQGESAVLNAELGADGGRWNLIHIPAGGARCPASSDTVSGPNHKMQMQGREVFKFAVTMMQRLLKHMTEGAGISISDVHLIIPHQSNLRIVESVADKLDLPRDLFMINLDRYGNTSAASIAMALHEAREQGRCGPGDLVLMIGFGAGLTWGSTLIRV